MTDARLAAALVAVLALLGWTETLEPEPGESTLARAADRLPARIDGDPAGRGERGARRNVAFLLYDGMDLVDFAGAGRVFEAAGSGRAFHAYTVAATRGPVTSQGFARFVPEYGFDDSPPPDVLVVPGGEPAGDVELASWLRSAASEAELVLSIGTGAYALADAGLLDGHRVAVELRSAEALRTSAPRAEVRPGERLVESGPLVSASGTDSGFDAALHAVAKLLGPGAARDVARELDYEWLAE